MDNKSSHINPKYNNQNDSVFEHKLPNTNVIYSKYGIEISGNGEDYSNVYINQIASVRTANTLASISIKTLEDLIIYLAKNGDQSLRFLRNFGKKSYTEIYDILDSFGISTNDLESVEKIINAFSY